MEVDMPIKMFFGVPRTTCPLGALYQVLNDFGTYRI